MLNQNTSAMLANNVILKVMLVMLNQVSRSFAMFVCAVASSPPVLLIIRLVNWKPPRTNIRVSSRLAVAIIVIQNCVGVCLGIKRYDVVVVLGDRFVLGKTEIAYKTTRKPVQPIVLNVTDY